MGGGTLRKGSECGGGSPFVLVIGEGERREHYSGERFEWIYPDSALLLSEGDPDLPSGPTHCGNPDVIAPNKGDYYQGDTRMEGEVGMERWKS